MKELEEIESAVSQIETQMKAVFALERSPGIRKHLNYISLYNLHFAVQILRVAIDVLCKRP